MTPKEYYNSTRMVETRHWTLEMALAFAEEYHKFAIVEKTIALTEDILVKCGGTYKSYGYGDAEWKSWNIDGESFRQNGNGITWASGDVDINYLHELQDLFRILKKQLTLKKD
jgi:hypothetical protein